MQEAFEPKPYSGKTAFEQWAAYEGVPMIRDFIVSDLNSIKVEPWERMGAKGCWIVLGAPNDQLSMASYICEIAAGSSIQPQKHLFEELIFILSGSGATTVWSEGGKSLLLSGSAAVCFSPPLNALHQPF